MIDLAVRRETAEMLKWRPKGAKRADKRGPLVEETASSPPTARATATRTQPSTGSLLLAGAKLSWRRPGERAIGRGKILLDDRRGRSLLRDGGLGTGITGGLF